MGPNTLDITNKLFENLKTNPTLAEYMAQFSKGGVGLNRNIFPFLLLDYPSFTPELLLAATGFFTYSFQIFVGAKSMAPGVAYQGNDSTKKGTAEICRDVVAVLVKNDMSGAFHGTAKNLQVQPKYMYDAAETLIIARISFDASVLFCHSPEKIKR